MNLYDYHLTPHELDHHAVAEETVPKLIWDKYSGTPSKLKSYEQYLKNDPKYAYRYARMILKGRWPEAEPAILKSPQWSMLYAAHVIRRRWPAAEPIIVKNGVYAYRYADEVVHGRWREGEKAILQDKENAFWYISHLVKKPMPEIEDEIAKDAYNSLAYAKSCIHGRFEKGEPAMKRISQVWDDYQKFLGYAVK